MGTYTTSTGSVLTYRRLALGTSDLIKAAVMREMAHERPAPPEQTVETANGPQTIVNETHPDHIEAVKAWDAKVEHEARLRMVRLVTDYGLEPTVTDTEAVARYRAAFEAIGVPLDDNDRDLYIWRIACPDQHDVNKLMAAIMGLEALEEAIGRGRQAFRRPVSGTVDLASTPAAG
jgi:hypothetical protein